MTRSQPVRLFERQIWTRDARDKWAYFKQQKRRRYLHARRGTTFHRGSRVDGHKDQKVEIRQPLVQSSDTSAAWTARCNKLSPRC